MDCKKLEAQWLAEESANFKGWDFSHLDGRWSHEDISWDYTEIIQNYLNPNHILLDMGTGGGEFLLTLRHPHHLTYVTEGYPPNVQVCMDNLAPLGITVRQIYDKNLPFADNYFDIIINRHESFNMDEVKRVLKPGGLFITQQVGGGNGYDLSQALIPGFVGEFENHTLKNNVEIISSRRFEILLKDEAFPIMRFYDIGAIVYFAKAVVWGFPGFSVQSCLPQLYKLQEILEEKGCVENREHRFVVVSKKL